jgi:excisionase family DNA binding protein
MSSGAERMTTELWVSVEDAAKHLGVARDSVYHWFDGRGLPAHKIGLLWRFKLSEVDERARAKSADAQEADDAPKTRGTR